MNFREYLKQSLDDDKLALNLNEAFDVLDKMGFTLGNDDDEGDPLDKIPYYKNERFEAWARKQGIDVYLSDESLCEKKYEEYKRLVRAKRDFE